MLIESLRSVPGNPGHCVLARSWTRHELLFVPAYIESGKDGTGPWRKRRQATVRFRADHVPLGSSLILWRGTYCSKRMRESPFLDAICAYMRVPPDLLLGSVGRHHTVFFELADEQSAAPSEKRHYSVAR